MSMSHVHVYFHVHDYFRAREEKAFLNFERFFATIGFCVKKTEKWPF
jgi:hypothetical protein